MVRRFSSQFLGMNSTLIFTDQSALLVDPGVFPPEIDRISDFIEKETLKEITILLTHTHGDHISGWNAFSQYKTFTHSIVSQKSKIVRDNDVRYLQGMYRKQGYENLKDLTFPHPLHYLNDGEVVKINPSDFCFYHTPGHSMDMSVIIIPPEKLLLSGDMLIHTPVPFILHSINQYWKSLHHIRKIIQQFDIQHLIPGHGKPALGQDEIVSRIQNEQDYIEKLIRKGRDCILKRKSDRELNKILLDCFPEFSSLHAHQSNIQTFIREQDDLQIDL
jgi:glyoxylase-like metal-dependent hydrolase (beta-lactamase superfamily II)